MDDVGVECMGLRPEKRRIATSRASENRLEGIIQSAMDAIITVDKNQNIVLFNAAAEKMFRCRAAEALGKSIARFIPTRFHSAHAGHMHKFGETGVTSRAMGRADAQRAMRADGEEFQAEASISQVKDQGDQFFTVILRDITERKRAEQNDELLAAIVRSSDDAIVTKSLDGTITNWNPSAERIFGYTSSEAIGQSIRMLLPPDRIGEEAAILARIVRGERVDHFETVRVRKDGGRIDISVTISPIKNGRGAVIGASKIARDITARKLTERLLAEKIQDLARSNADLEQFAYVASHDLQEPLRMVTAYTQLLAERYRGRLDENADKFITYASDGAVRMQALIRDLLAFSRAGRSAVPSMRVESESALQEVLQILGPAIKESGAVVKHEPLPVVWAERSQVTQILQNLIGNAIKFRGPAPPVISVQAEQSGEHWLFSVSDNGIGIPLEQAENIFVIFQRLHTRSEYPGNGIGLSICKKIVEHNGGKIWVESQAGHGSAFKFTLPCDGPHERAGIGARADDGHAAGAIATEHSLAMAAPEK